MSDKTGIQWCDATWNPVRGCSMVSPGCTNCYAMTMAARFDRPGMWGEGLTRNGRWNGRVVPQPDKLGDPLRWRKPRRIFVNSTSDLFHEDVPNKFIAAVFGVMSAAPQHTFQILTKRAERMERWFRAVSAVSLGYGDMSRGGSLFSAENASGRTLDAPTIGAWPLPNVWLGVSVEDQERADERIPHLLRTPAAVRFLSCEPLLGLIDLEDIGDVIKRDALAVDTEADSIGGEEHALSWVIVGGESGRNARPCDVAWIRDIVGQCREAGVACFTKQLGARPLWRNIADMPIDVYRAWDAQRAGEPFPEDGVVAPLRDSHGGDPAEWSEPFPREFPEVTP